MWNPDHKAFTRSKADVELYHLYKMPLCCGQIECYNMRTRSRQMEVLRKGYSELEKRRVIPAQKRKPSMEDIYYGEDCGSEERPVTEIMGIATQHVRPKCMSSDGR